MENTSQPDSQFGARSARVRVLQSVEAFSDLFDLAPCAKGVSVVDGVADSSPVGAGGLDSGVVAVLSLFEGLAGVVELVSEPEAADPAGVGVLTLKSVELGPGIDEVGVGGGDCVLER
jgi:hypothetical protein